MNENELTNELNEGMEVVADITTRPNTAIIGVAGAACGIALGIGLTILYFKKKKAKEATEEETDTEVSE